MVALPEAPHPRGEGPQYEITAAKQEHSFRESRACPNLADLEKFGFLLQVCTGRTVAEFSERRHGRKEEGRERRRKKATSLIWMILRVISMPVLSQAPHKVGVEHSQILFTPSFTVAQASEASRRNLREDIPVRLFIPRPHSTILESVEDRNSISFSVSSRGEKTVLSSRLPSSSLLY
jgi:hypothetical protein